MAQALRPDKCPAVAVTAPDHQPLSGSLGRDQHSAACADSRAQAGDHKRALLPAAGPPRDTPARCSCFQMFPSLSCKTVGQGFWIPVCKQDQESRGANLPGSEQHF